MTASEYEPILRKVCPSFRPSLAFRIMTTPRYRRAWTQYIKHRHYMERRGKYIRSIDAVAEEEIRMLRAELRNAVELLGLGEGCYVVWAVK